MAPHPDFLDRFDPAWRHCELQRSSASLVRIVLAEPSEEETTAFLFMRLFALANANAAAAGRRTSGPGPARADAGDCETLTFDDVPYACCPPASGSGPWDCSILL
jgi:hypothetical protein